MNEDYPCCFLCGRNGNGDPLEVHHIFGGASRKKSDKFGLTVLLCGSRCHRNGKYAVHRNKETADMIHRYGQKKAMQENGWTVEEFRTVFGRSYI